MAGEIVVPFAVKSLASTIARLGLGGRREGPSPQAVFESSPAYDDPELLAKEIKRVERTPPGRFARTKADLLRSMERRLSAITPPATPPAPPDELPGDELPGDELPEDEYTDLEEAEDEYYADEEAENFEQPWFQEGTDSEVFDPTEQPGDVQRREVEKASGDVAPYAVEYYKSRFVDDRTTRTPPVRRDLPPKVGRMGSSGAIVEGIIGLIRLGRQLWELQTETLPEPAKGPKSRPRGKARIETLPDPEPITVTLRKRAVVRVDDTTRRAIERTNTKAPELEEIRVTKTRRAVPATRALKIGKTQRAPARVGIAELVQLYDLVRRKPERRTIVRERVITQPGSPEIPTMPTDPVLVPQPPVTGRTPAEPELPERVRVEQTLTQGQKTRTKEKKCAKEREKRTTCYKGFYRERKNSTAKKRWTKIDCLTGKELRHG
jgi:hypothetical protein